MSSIIGNYRFNIDAYLTDFRGKATLPQMSSFILQAATKHAEERGFGMATLNEENYTWVLSRLAIEMTEMPCQYEPFSVQTWVENVYRLFTDRNFAILDKDGHPLGYARSVWAMINMHTRRPIDLLEVNGGSITEYICDAPCPIDKPSRIKVHAEGPSASLRAKYSDIDINGHVNSIRYIEHILDLFPLEQYRQKRIRRFEMAYVAESYYDDQLDFYLETEAGEDTCNVEIRKNGTETVCRSKITFEENQIHV